MWEGAGSPLGRISSPRLPNLKRLFIDLRYKNSFTVAWDYVSLFRGFSYTLDKLSTVYQIHTKWLETMFPNDWQCSSNNNALPVNFWGMFSIKWKWNNTNIHRSLKEGGSVIPKRSQVTAKKVFAWVTIISLRCGHLNHTLDCNQCSFPLTGRQCWTQ